MNDKRVTIRAHFATCMKVLNDEISSSRNFDFHATRKNLTKEGKTKKISPRIDTCQT